MVRLLYSSRYAVVDYYRGESTIPCTRLLRSAYCHLSTWHIALRHTDRLAARWACLATRWIRLAAHRGIYKAVVMKHVLAH
jgi:hypothetical protein